MVGGSRQKTLDIGSVLFGTEQQDLHLILKGLMPFDEFHPVSPSFTYNLLNQNKIERNNSSSSVVIVVVVVVVVVVAVYIVNKYLI
ncbi:unnamed protein product [Schistosoma curassoni]|uniref:Ovule protein n=1 Tax=Schistosoma curassoni TaxID=6186 RepID=A0A183KCW3_9TREM|nr:unnamed protein product [Schistosoma curassoni]